MSIIEVTDRPLRPNKHEILKSCDRAIQLYRDLPEDERVRSYALAMGIKAALEWASEYLAGNIVYDSDPQCGGICESCNCKLNYKGEIHHHPIPRRGGGETTLDNTVLLCTDCHTKIDRW